MATFTLTQSAVSGSGVDPATATFGAAPTQGNVLIAVGMERSGGAAANATITGTGWTKEIARTIAPLDGSYRRTFVVWWKLAGAGEPTAITYDDGTSNGKQLLVAEYQADQAGTFAFAGAVSADNDLTPDAVTINTGDTPSLPAGEYLMIGAGAWKNQGGAATGTTWASIALTQDAFIGGDRALAVASGRETTGGVKTSTVTWANSGVGNRGLAAGLLAFEFSTGSPPPPGPQPLAGAATASGTATGNLTAAGASRTIELELYDADGTTLLANKTGLRVHIYASFSAWAAGDAALQVLTGQSTNASGVLSVQGPGSLTVGALAAFIVVSDIDATPDSAEGGWMGLVDVI